MAEEKKTNALISTSEALSGPGALSLDFATSVLTTTGADAFTLADGVVGQRKRIILAVDGGDATITPATFLNGTTITFADAGDSIDLEWVTTLGWATVGSTGAPVVA